MKKFVLAAVAAAVAMPMAPSAPAFAQTRDQLQYEREMRQYERDVAAYERQQRRYNRRLDRRWRNYDYNRLPPGQREYYADRYYRYGNYAPRRLGVNDRVYRGSDGRYYCRRSDGSTGLIIGGIAGGLLGSAIARGNSNTLGAIIGAAGGALAGRAIERDNVTCR